jgi:hypothetical protein
MVDASVLLQQLTAAMARPHHATYRLQLGPSLGFWGETWLSLGDTRLAGVYRDRVSGLPLTTESRDGAPALRGRERFAAFPVALLEREDAAA